MNAIKLIELFDHAAQHLKWPKIRYQTEHCKIQFSRMSEGSRMPGSLWVSDGQFGYDHMYCIINRQANVIWNQQQKPNSDIIHAIYDFVEKPVELSQISGRSYNHCCFCGRELTDARSVFYGYGPICANNWGLPWDDAMEVKQEMKENELADKIKNLL